jgi:hypothetical protein
MGLNSNSNERIDVNSRVYDTAEIAVPSSGEVLCETPGANAKRQWIYVKNLGPGKVGVGPTGKPKDVLIKNQGKFFNNASNLEIYAELDSGGSATVFVEESG